MSKVRIVIFLDNPLGRDTEITLPVAYCLEKYSGCDIRFKFIWEIYFIKLWQPDVVMVPSTRGHPMYTEASDFAYSMNIKVLALDSEGNFPTDGYFDIWGYNKKRIIYQEFITCWSERTATYYKKILDKQYIEKLVVTGGTGFDRYKFGKKPNRETLLKKYKKTRYTKVIGYAGWAFGKLYSADRDQTFWNFFPGDRERALQWIEQQRIHVRDSLKYVIEKNPDILFILKKHPKENFESDPVEGKNEMNELLHLPNVLYLKKEEQIHDLISISDLWLGFETNTSLEAWMLQVPTILINETIDFPRSPHYKGSIICKDGIHLQTIIEKFYSAGKLEEFENESLAGIRSQLFYETIGFSDGMNHLRTYAHFKIALPQFHVTKTIPLRLRHFRLWIIYNFGWPFYNKTIFMLLPKFKKAIYVFENKNMKGLQERKRIVYAQLEEFHRANKSYIDKNFLGRLD